MNYKKTLRSAELSIKNKDYASCVMQCGTLMESALRDLLHLINKDGDLAEKNRIHEAERLIGNGKLSLSYFCMIFVCMLICMHYEYYRVLCYRFIVWLNAYNN